MKVQLFTAAHFAPLESSWRTKYLLSAPQPGEIIYSEINKNYAFFLPEIMVPEPNVLWYVISDLIWNCQTANISLALFSFSPYVVKIIQDSLLDCTLKPEEVDLWWVEIFEKTRIYTTLKLKK